MPCRQLLFIRVAPDIISGPGPGRNPAVFQIRPRLDMTAEFEAGFMVEVQCQQISNIGKGCTDVPCTSSHQRAI